MLRSCTRIVIKARCTKRFTEVDSGYYGFCFFLFMDSISNEGVDFISMYKFISFMMVWHGWPVVFCVDSLIDFAWWSDFDKMRAKAIPQAFLGSLKIWCCDNSAALLPLWSIPWRWVIGWIRINDLYFFKVSYLALFTQGYINTHDALHELSCRLADCLFLDVLNR